MLKKDYVLIAKLLKENKCSSYHEMVGNFSFVLAEDNPKFNKDRFIAACYKERRKMYNLGPGIKFWNSLARSPQSSFPLHTEEPVTVSDSPGYTHPQSIPLVKNPQKGPWSLKVEE